MNANSFPNRKQWVSKLNLSLSKGQGDSESIDSQEISSQDSLISEQNLRASLKENFHHKNYAVAIALLTELINHNPHNAKDYNNRGLMHFKVGEYDQALEDYNQALSLNPRLDGAYNNRANCYAQKGDLAAAIADYDSALDFNPANLRAVINQAITFRQLGLYGQALENLDIALFLGRRLKGRIYLERGRTYHLRGDWNCAVADYKRALENLPNNGSHGHQRRQIEAWLDELLLPMIA